MDSEKLLGVEQIVQRLKSVRGGQLTGIRCTHGWDTSVCPMKGCGDDEDELVGLLLERLPTPENGLREALERIAAVDERPISDGGKLMEVLRIARSALQHNTGERDGLITVPRVPTEAMLIAGSHMTDDDGDARTERVRGIWFAMIESLSQAPR